MQTKKRLWLPLFLIALVCLVTSCSTTTGANTSSISAKKTPVVLTPTRTLTPLPKAAQIDSYLTHLMA